MVYNNFIYRFIISIILISSYAISLYNKNILFFLVSSLYIIIFYEVSINFKKYFNYILIYIILSYLSFIIFFFKFLDFYLLNILVLTVILFDSFSYLIGTLLGKNFIFKKISPKKTLEGYLGGYFLTNLIFLVYEYFVSSSMNILNLLILVNLIIFFSILGDLLQSYFKRKNNIKDSSKLLPGHGGFFDRFDGFIFSIIFILFYSIL